MGQLPPPSRVGAGPADVLVAARRQDDLRPSVLAHDAQGFVGGGRRFYLVHLHLATVVDLRSCILLDHGGVNTDASELVAEFVGCYVYDFV